MKSKKRPIIIALVVLVLLCAAGYLYVQNENAKAAMLIREEEAAQAEMDRIAVEQAEAEQAEADRVAAEQAETDRLAAEQAATEQAEADRLAAEQAAKPKPTTPAPKAAEPSPNQYAPSGEDIVEKGPEGDKPGYTYIPGYGYVKDGGGGIIEGDHPDSEDNLTGNIIAY